jgi:hypothetical protein
VRIPIRYVLIAIVFLLLSVVVQGWCWKRREERIQATSAMSERKAQHFDELCRMVDTETKIAERWQDDPDAAQGARAVIESMHRFEVICRQVVP